MRCILRVLRTLLEILFFDGTVPLCEKIIKATKHDNKLAKMMNDCVRRADDKIYVSFDMERIERIMLKLSLGHIANKLDSTFEINESFLSCDIKLLPDFTNEELNDFQQLPILDRAGEVGSDFVQDIIVFSDINTGSDYPVIFWQDVQNGNYRYIAYPDERGGLTVRIVICEALYAEVRFK